MHLQVFAGVAVGDLCDFVAAVADDDFAVVAPRCAGRIARGWQRLVERKYALAAAREGLRTLMRARPAPTAIVCGNDVLAFGALLEAQKLGLAVPAQLSIVGFDDLEIAAHVQPGLTTVRVPAEEMWRKAADRVIGALRGIEPPRDSEIEVALVVRGSTGPPSSRPRSAATPKKPR